MQILGILYAIVMGILPMAIYAALLTVVDRFEKEPWWLLVGTFLWGAVVAAGSALIINTVFGLSLYALTGSEGLASLGTAVISAPLVEETVKGSAVLVVFLFFRHEFDSVLDGIIYGSLVGFGFAATENINYIWEAFVEGGFTAAIAITFARAIGIAFLHAFLTSWTGVGFALFRLNHQAWRWLTVPAGYGLAIGFHAFHNLLASVNILTCILALFVDWLGVFGFLVLIAFLVWRERRVMREQLVEEVNLGVISREHYAYATSITGQMTARWSALLQGKFVTDQMYDALGELAFKKEQLAQGGYEHEPQAPTRIAQLREKITQLRGQGA